MYISQNNDKKRLTAKSFTCYLILADLADVFEVSGMKQTKRKRGGQPGNQNGRTHGFYSSFLTPDEINQFCKIANTERVSLDIALLRIKLQCFVRKAPENRRVLNEVIRLMSRRFTAQYHLSRMERSRLKAVVAVILEQASGSLPVPPKNSEKIMELLQMDNHRSGRK